MDSTTASCSSALQTVRLATGQVHRLTGPLRGSRLCVMSGCVWVTQPGELDDHFLSAGGQLVLSGRGPVVLEGVGPGLAELRVPRRAARIVAPLARMRRHLFRRWVPAGAR
jgi:hypothetical protein